MQNIFDLNGCDTTVTQSGEGLPLILLHGGPGAFDYLDSLAPMLIGHRLIRYDQRGGGQAGSAGPHSVSQLLADLEALRLQLGHDSWIVAGHSWGAFLALAYAAKYPQHTRAVLHISGTGLDLDWQKAYHANRRKRLSPPEQITYLHLRQERENACAGKQAEINRQLLDITLKADFCDPAKAAALPDMLAYPIDPGVQEALMADWQQHLLDASFRQSVANLAMPVLCLHGDAD
ncbi:MAG: hypothetical protein CVV27_12715, partial [Candidatus Melainabacteria bacterium HGW-Melainabacteria-1]